MKFQVTHRFTPDMVLLKIGDEIEIKDAGDALRFMRRYSRCIVEVADKLEQRQVKPQPAPLRGPVTANRMANQITTG